MAMREVNFNSSGFGMFTHGFRQVGTGSVVKGQAVYNLSLEIGDQGMSANFDFGRRIGLVAGVVGRIGDETGQYGYTLFDPMARRVLLHMEGKFEEGLAGAEGVYFKTDESEQAQVRSFTLQKVRHNGKVRMCSDYNRILPKQPRSEHLISYRLGAFITELERAVYFSPFLIGFVQAKLVQRNSGKIDKDQIKVNLVYSLTDGSVLQAHAQVFDFRYSLPYFPFNFGRLAPGAQFPNWEVPLGSDPFTRDERLQEARQT